MNHLRTGHQRRPSANCTRLWPVHLCQGTWGVYHQRHSALIVALRSRSHTLGHQLDLSSILMARLYTTTSYRRSRGTREVRLVMFIWIPYGTLSTFWLRQVWHLSELALLTLPSGTSADTHIASAVPANRIYHVAAQISDRRCVAVGLYQRGIRDGDIVALFHAAALEACQRQGGRRAVEVGKLDVLDLELGRRAVAGRARECRALRDAEGRAAKRRPVQVGKG